MKRFTHTQPGTWPQSRNLKAALIALGVLAAAVFFTVPAFAQDDFPWATKVNVGGLSDAEMATMMEPRESGGYTIVKTMPEFPNCPQWVKDIYAAPDDPDDYNDRPMTKTFNLQMFLNLYKRNPKFSSDGKWIVFDDQAWVVWKVPVGGGEPAIVFDWYPKLKKGSDGKTIISNEALNLSFGLSPDGKEVAGLLRIPDVESKVMLGDGTAWKYTHAAYRIIAGTIGTREQRTISEDAIAGAWSHDGRLFVYVKRDSTKDPSSNLIPFEDMIAGLYVKDLSSGLEWCIAPIATCPQFSPDDSVIICSMKDANNLWQIFSIPREGGNARQLTFYGANDTGRNARVTDVSPNGRWVLHTGDFTVGAVTKTGMCVCNIVTGESFPLFPEAECITTDGSWSPDGTKIVFSASAPRIDVETGKQDGRNIFELYIADFHPEKYEKPTDVAVALPSGFAITGNHPNPFNPSTTISFTLPVNGNTQLAVYDITGRLVRSLVNGQMTSGVHSVVWNGRDESGRLAATGVYLSRLSQNGRTTANRMLLAK